MAKSKYDETVKSRFCEIEKWLKNGLIDIEIAKNLGIGKTTFYRYVNEHPELAELLKKGKEVVDDIVENALFKRAIGYSYTEITKEACGDGMMVTKEVIKEVPPDTTAQIYWLNNRRPEQWRNRREVKHEGSIGLEGVVNEIEERLFESNKKSTC